MKIDKSLIYILLGCITLHLLVTTPLAKVSSFVAIVMCVSAILTDYL